MPKIEQPMLAQDYDPVLHRHNFPFYASPKVDGIRAYISDGVVWARSNKPIPNRHIQETFPRILPEGTDFELMAGVYSAPDHFQNTMSMVMSHENRIEGLAVHVFDYLDPNNPVQPYSKRIAAIASVIEAIPMNVVNYQVLKPVALRKPEDIEVYLQRCLKKGYEGIILRDPNGTYKFGRPSQEEALLLRYKPLTDAEAVIIGFKELEHNDNPETISPTGKTVRSSAQDGKRGGATLGGFIVRSLSGDSGVERTGSGPKFSVGNGPGLTQALRQALWDRRETLIGSIIRYSYLKSGTKPGGKPRMPKFLGFRDPIDLS